MNATDHRPDVLSGQDEEFVELNELVCNGCGWRVRPEPPRGWPAGAGAAPGFSHGDGSVLCPDEHGRIGEPMELPGVAGERYELTEAGRAALAALEAGERS